MATDPRTVVEGVQVVGANETVQFLVSNLAIADGLGAASAFDESNDDTNVTGTVLSGSGNGPTDGVITFPFFANGTPHHRYRVVQQYTAGGATLDCIIHILVKP